MPCEGLKRGSRKGHMKTIMCVLNMNFVLNCWICHPRPLKCDGIVLPLPITLGVSPSLPYWTGWCLIQHDRHVLDHSIVYIDLWWIVLWLEVEIILVLVLHWQLPFVKPDIKQLFSYIWCSFAQAKVGGGKVHLADYFDLFSGTSTGAVLATMLVTPNEKGEPLFTADGCCRFYQEQGKYIFKPHWYDPFHGSLRQLYRPKYSARRFENLLKLYTVRKGQALTLLDTLKPIVVTSFDISKATPFFFVRHAATKDPSHNFRSQIFLYLLRK